MANKKDTKHSGKVVLKFPPSVPLDQINVEFLQGMLDRMAMGFFNYGHMHQQFPHKHDALANHSVRMKKYKRTKNTEWLMDAANYCMIEFSRPKLRGAYFEPTPKSASPGSVRRDGRVVAGKDEEQALGLA